MTALVILPQAAFAAADTHQVPVKCYENYDDRFGYAVSPSHLAGSFSYGKPSPGTFRLLGSVNKETTLNGYAAYAVTDGLTIGYSYDGSFKTKVKEDWKGIILFSIQKWDRPQ